EDVFSRPPLSALVKHKKRSPFPEIELYNGSFILGRGANSPNFIRGNKPHLVVVDEAAFVEDDTILRVIEPMFNVTGKEPGAALILISSPFGNGAFQDFYTLGQDTHQSRYISHHFTSYDNPYADRAALDATRDRYGENSPLWQVEYMGRFADADSQVF